MYPVYNFGAFAVKTAKINLFVKPWLSVCNNLRTTEKISWKQIMEGFAKIWQHIPVWLKSNSSNVYYT
jgi:hypothetical protein